MRAHLIPPMSKRYSLGKVGPAIKQWLWSSRAIVVGLPLLFSSASPPRQQAAQPPPNIAVNQDLLTELTVTQPPTTALAVDRPSSSPYSSPNLSSQSSTLTPQTAQAQQSLSLAARPQLTPPDTIPEIPVRIGIARRVPQLQISTSTPAIIMDDSGEQIAALTANTAVNVKVGSNQMSFGDLQAPQVIWVKPDEQGLTAVNGRWYRGSVQLILDRKRLIAVNHLDLESYLYSVVGAEMSASWPIEALKAQAVAARSYALARISSNRASPFYDLGDTPRWQAYRGVETEANTTQLAVDSTQGLLISHKGAVVESLYASTPHLVRTVHKGYGMSQYGARELARKQLDYQQILNHYYPGTTLTWLQAS